MINENICIRLKSMHGNFQLQADLELPAKGITVLFGPSGSGKTTMLRCVAGLEKPTGAFIRIGQELWQDDANGIFMSPWQRDLGYVFQEASLFEHLDVQDNLTYGFKRSPKSGADKANALTSSIKLLGIADLMHRRPAHLSGGERQRVAIARALAMQPQLLLLDEPLASLDFARRHEILPWLERMRDELILPMLYVSHSPDEVARLADHLVVLDNGLIQTYGPVQEVLARIESPVIVGEDAGVLLHGIITLRDEQWHLAQVSFSGGSLWVRDNALPLGQQVRLRVLARDISITTKETLDTSIQNHLQGKIEAIVMDTHPSQALVSIRCGVSILLARITRRALSVLHLKEGANVWAQIKSVAVIEKGDSHSPFRGGG